MSGEGYNHVILCLVDVVRQCSPQCVGSVHLYTPPSGHSMWAGVCRGERMGEGEREGCLHSKYVYDQAFHVINLDRFYEFVKVGETVLIRITII